jgi:hypothetical protein
VLSPGASHAAVQGIKDFACQYEVLKFFARYGPPGQGEEASPVRRFRWAGGQLKKHQ